MMSSNACRKELHFSIIQITLTQYFLSHSCEAFIHPNNHIVTTNIWLSPGLQSSNRNKLLNGIDTSSKIASTKTDELHEPDESSTFGRKTFWDEFYRDQISSESHPDGFSWYSSWISIKPFWEFLFSNHTLNDIQSNPILLPGVGNDPTIVEMYDDGWSNITAFDYSPQGVESCKAILGDGRLKQTNNVYVQVDVADARQLSYESDYFMGVLDKGTLDSIYLSGGKDPQEKRKQLRLAVNEMTRIVKGGGIFLSLTGVATDEIYEAMKKLQINDELVWAEIWDTRESVIMTDTGYASIDVDATMLAFKRL